MQKERKQVIAVKDQNNLSLLTYTECFILMLTEFFFKLPVALRPNLLIELEYLKSYTLLMLEINMLV